MKMREYKKFSWCNAPVCPLDEDNEHTFRYKDEAICKRTTPELTGSEKQIAYKRAKRA